MKKLLLLLLCLPIIGFGQDEKINYIQKNLVKYSNCQHFSMSSYNGMVTIKVNNEIYNFDIIELVDGGKLRYERTRLSFLVGDLRLKGIVGSGIPCISTRATAPYNYPKYVNEYDGFSNCYGEYDLFLQIGKHYATPSSENAPLIINIYDNLEKDEKYSDESLPRIEKCYNYLMNLAYYFNKIKLEKDAILEKNRIDKLRQEKTIK